MQEVDWIWLNGKLVPWKEAKVHFLTHSLHYGTAVFEGIRCYKTGKGPAVFRLKDHVKRLFKSAEIVGMKELPFSEEQIAKAAKTLIKKNGLQECYIRPLLFYGYGKMGLDTIGAKIDAGIAIWPWDTYLGEEGVKKGVSARISSVARIFSKDEFAHAKVSGAYSNSTFAKMEALNSGFEEAIMLDTEGNVAECTGENIFIVKDGKLLTPEKSSILVGITRDSIIKLAGDEGISVSECKISKGQLYSADECFITGTAAEVTPIREVDKKPIVEGKPGPVTKKLQKLYSDAVHGNFEKWDNWMDFLEAGK